MSNLVPRAPTYALAVLPDTERYKCRYKVASESSDRVYLISFDMAERVYKCDCRGCISRGQCKHLTAGGHRGRLYGPQESEYRMFLNGDVRRETPLPSLPEIEKMVGPVKKQKKRLPMSDETRAMVNEALGLPKEAPKGKKALPAPVVDDLLE